MRASVLLVDDDADMLAALEGTLLDADFTVTACSSGGAALQALVVGQFDAVVTDLRMPVIDGVNLCSKIAGNHPGLPVILVTAYGDLDAALAAMRAGAFDFITKPFSDAELLLALERALRYRRSMPDASRTPSAMASADPRGQLVGESAPMKAMMQALRDVGATDRPVLLLGEAGSGRELAARTLHAQSARAGGAFVVVDGAAADVEVALVGERSAGAPGLLGAAEGGSLFLRNVASVPLPLQDRLLEALVPSGRRPDVRVVASSDVDLGRAADRGQVTPTVRKWLATTISVPSLRQRGDDVVGLARYFLGRCGRGPLQISEAARARLLNYPWPGNVRELKSCMESAAVLAQDGVIEPQSLPARVQVHAPGRSRTPQIGSLTLEAVERAHIESVMQATSGNKARAASVLGIDRTTLYRKLKHYEPGS